jgi:hypothetical protein
MWLAILDQKNEYDVLSKTFLKLERKLYENKETPFGTQLLVVKDESSLHLPSFLLLDENPERHRDAYRWVYKNLPIDTFVSTGILEQSNLSTPQELTAFIPNACLRSAGHLDFHSGPVLYEEMFFDAPTQKNIYELLQAQHWPTLTNRPLFGANKMVKQEELHSVIEKDLNSPGWDNFSAELMIFARHFSVKCACLKLCRPSNDTKDLAQLWKVLIQSRFSEPVL